MLNSNCTIVSCAAGSAQEQWLRADLAANSAQCTVALFHHPRFSSGSSQNNTSVAPFWNALYDFNADLVLSGHDHAYERFARQNASGGADSARGIQQFVVGTGGVGINGFGTHPAQQPGPRHLARRAAADAEGGELRLPLRAGRRADVLGRRQRHLPLT